MGKRLEKIIARNEAAEAELRKAMTPSQRWFLKFCEEKEIDMSEPVIAGDNSTLFVGDVCSHILSAPSHEMDKIKNVIVMIDFKNGDVVHFFKHLAKALNKTHKL